MKHHTEAERAEFEAWINGQQHAIPGWIAYDTSKDNDGDYLDEVVAVAWLSWYAARRAPAVPVQQGLVKDHKWQIETCHRMFDRMGIERDDGEDFYSVWGRVCLAFEKVANVEIHIPLCGEVVYKHVAAAPQPPEAAPVELPEPAGVVVTRIGNYASVNAAHFVRKGEKFYTEQQVRELLAAQASVSNGTLPNQPTFKTEDGEKAREPLTDEQVCDALGIDGSDDWTFTVARAIERAHGIGKDKA